MTQPANQSTPKRHDHSFLNRRLTVYAKPTAPLVSRHLKRLDGSFLRLSNDFLWLNDDEHIRHMMSQRATISGNFMKELDSIIGSYTDILRNHHIPDIELKTLRPEASFDFELHSSSSLDAIRIFEKLDLIFILLEAMKQNGLIDELAFIHACNAWKNSTGHFAKNIHELRAQCMQASLDKKEK